MVLGSSFLILDRLAGTGLDIRTLNVLFIRLQSRTPPTMKLGSLTELYIRRMPMYPPFSTPDPYASA